MTHRHGNRGGGGILHGGGKRGNSKRAATTDVHWRKRRTADERSEEPAQTTRPGRGSQEPISQGAGVVAGAAGDLEGAGTAVEQTGTDVDVDPFVQCNAIRCLREHISIGRYWGGPNGAPRAMPGGTGVAAGATGDLGGASTAVEQTGTDVDVDPSVHSLSETTCLHRPGLWWATAIQAGRANDAAQGAPRWCKLLFKADPMGLHGRTWRLPWRLPTGRTTAASECLTAFIVRLFVFPNAATVYLLVVVVICMLKFSMQMLANLT